MDCDDYQAKLRALGIDRGKLDSGFGEKVEEEPERPKPVTDSMETCVRSGAARKTDVVAARPPKVKPLNHCRCGVVISVQAERCRKCFQEDLKKARGQLAPSPPPPPREEPDEDCLQWTLLTEKEIEKIALAVIEGNGGMAHLDDIEATVVEMTTTRLGSMLCTLVLRGDIGVACRNGAVFYGKPGMVGVDWDFVI